MLEKLDMTMFEVKYLEKWTSVFCEIGFVFFLISCRSGLGKPSIAIDWSIANSSAVDRKYFSFKKIYGRSYLIYLIIGTQIGASFAGERCKLCFKIIIVKIFSKKTPQPQNSKKIILNSLTNCFVIFLFADVFEKITLTS